jgi:hypothetical protein
MTATPKSTTNQRTIWIAIITLTIFVASFLVWSSARSANSMTAAASTDQSFTQAPPGAKVKLVLEITESTPDGLIRGKLLDKQTEKLYSRTTTAVTAHSSGSTKIVMGKSSDIHPAAVIHITGAVKNDHTVDAEQIVILTGYVEIK